MTERIGIMGGTFDPIHFGHLDAARAACDECSLDRVLFMPTGDPNFKRGAVNADAAARFEMVELALADEPAFEPSSLEIDRAGVTYTCDTLVELHENMPDARFFFILGADSALTLPKWKNAAALAPLCTFVVVERPGFDYSELRATFDACPIDFELIFIHAKTRDVSSTRVRECISRGQSLEGLMPAPVITYIESNDLYA